MTVALRFAAAVDAITGFIGRNIAWLVLAAVVVSAANATVRKIFDISSNAWLELQWYLYGAVFLLSAAWALKNNAHVRIDILSGRLSQRTRHWIDLACHIVMLLPVTLIMVWLSAPDAWTSFQNQSMSPNAGGLIEWPAKAMIVAGFALLLAQCVSEIIKRIAVITGIITEDIPTDPGYSSSGVTYDVRDGKRD